MKNERRFIMENFYDKVKSTQDNVSVSENGMVGYKTTNHALLDFNFKVASYRGSLDEAMRDFDKVLQEKDGLSNIEVTLYTGKTHQIRAHLAYVNHPIVGDGKYGDFAINEKLGQKKQNLTATELILNFEKESPLYYLNGKKFII